MSEAEILEKPIKVFAALHNAMTEESSAYTISIHFSREGAEKAIRKSKSKAKAENTHHRNYWLKKGETLCAELYDKKNWNKFQWWGINEIEILP
jgi:hypothetical protein